MLPTVSALAMVDLFFVGPLGINANELRRKTNIALQENTFDKNICNIIANLWTFDVLDKLQYF